tara:strand:- start:585 stop:731 length:147 start_codon:yes stop_codon:yes gene_type:complete
MQDDLPPPNWSPTGKNGYWVWHDEEEKWHWYSDEEYKEIHKQNYRIVK